MLRCRPKYNSRSTGSGFRSLNKPSVRTVLCLAESTLAQVPEPLYIPAEYAEEIRERREQLVRLMARKKLLETKISSKTDDEVSSELEAVGASIEVCKSLLEMREEEIGRLSFESRVFAYPPEKRAAALALMRAWYKEWLLITYDSPFARRPSSEMTAMPLGDLADRLQTSSSGMLRDRDAVSEKYRLLLVELMGDD